MVGMETSLVDSDEASTGSLFGNRECFMGDLRWSSKWTKKKNQLLRGGQCVNKVSQSLFETVA